MTEDLKNQRKFEKNNWRSREAKNIAGKYNQRESNRPSINFNYSVERKLKGVSGER
jgi:hypothetical protein